MKVADVVFWFFMGLLALYVGYLLGGALFMWMLVG